MIKSLVAAASTAGLFMASATSGSDLAIWERLILQGGSFAVLMFLFIHVMTKTQPEQLAFYAKSIETITNSFSLEADRLRQDNQQNAQRMESKLEEREQQIIALMKSCQTCNANMVEKINKHNRD